MVELHFTEVDHVFTIWTDGPPPLRAGLLFRAGKAAETFATAGQIHLIEHLALSTLADLLPSQNGIVFGTNTGFYKVGKPHEVVSFFSNVCDALKSLPSDRLEGEKQILEAEIATRPYDFRSKLLTRRYGASGYGLLGMPEIGYRNATLEQLQEYSTQRFTKENAVLWLSGPPPNDLTFKLPHGTKLPLPPLAPIQKTFPGWFLDNECRGVAAGATVPRVSASTIFCEIASRRLFNRLRTVKSISYMPSVIYEPLDADTAHLVLYADSTEEHRVELANTFGEVFKELGKVEESEVEAAKRQICKSWSGIEASLTDQMVVEVQRAAMDWIFGKEFESLESLEAELLSISVDDVSAFSEAMQAEAIFALPSGAALQPWFGNMLPLSIGSLVKGRETLRVDAPIERQRLVHSPDGVSMLFPDGSHFTVQYPELAGAVYYKDGCVSLIGLDAAIVKIEPTLWRDGQNICREIRERVPTHLVLEQYSRSPDAIPKPRTTALQRFHAILTQRYGLMTYPMIIFMLINLIIVLQEQANFKDPFVSLAFVSFAFTGFYALARWFSYKG